MKNLNDFGSIEEIGVCRECGLPFTFVAEFMCKGDITPRLAAFCQFEHQRQIRKTKENRKLINAPMKISSYFGHHNPHEKPIF